MKTGKKYRITGSTLYNGLGLRSLKDQIAHFNKVIHGIDIIFSEEEKKRMEHGTINEENAVCTLTGKFSYKKYFF